MNKRVVIPIIIIILLVIGIVGVILLRERPAVVITLDINPSIEINLDKENKVMSVKALNDDGKKILDGDYKGLSIDEIVNEIVSKVIENDYIDSEHPAILIHTSGDINTKEISDNFHHTFGERNVDVEMIIIDEITKEDEKLAKKYNISPAKAAYLNEIDEKYESIEIEELVDKSVTELEETKETGKYCENGYELRGDDCFKAIKTAPAIEGDICQAEYGEYKGKCYPEDRPNPTGKKICRSDFTLKDGKCIKVDTAIADAVYTCSSGVLGRKGDWFKIGAPDNDRYICVDPNSGVAPTLRCLKQPHKIIGGECYVGPAPTINGGCPNGDKLVSGGCYSKDPGDQWECPDGNIYSKKQNTVPDKCPDTLKFTWATISEYKCPEGMNLDGNKCVLEQIEDPFDEMKCPSGYTEVEGGRCLNLSKGVSKQHGYFCDIEDSVLEDKECIVYERKKAKQ